LNKNGFDGVRIIDLPDLVDNNLFKEWIKEVKKISSETFEDK
jgi:hypothetical protein